ncbi:glycoside hydrolase superfamily [Obelidium mucronatum]|nr:glycoside hydrolase superfamily [Obelidium mucronatum]
MQLHTLLSVAAATAATVSASTACTEPWNPTQNYPAQSTVSHNGINWSNKWYENAGSAPGASTGDGGWVSNGSCDNVAADKLKPTKKPKKTTTKKTVKKTSTKKPTVPTKTTASPKPPAPTTGGGGGGGLELCQPKFSPGTVYGAGQQVSYEAVNYKASYQTSATPGGQFNGWTKIGPCNPESLKPRPYTTPGLIGYWTTWSPYSRKQNSIDKIDLTGFTAINYAFMNVNDQGNIITFDSWADQNWMAIFNGQRTKYPQLRTIVSLGGWSGSKHFSTIAKSPTLRQTFAQNVLKFIDSKGFDGVDIDWEYPGGGGIECNSVDPNDAANFALLLKDLRAVLGPDRIISMATSAEPSKYTVKATKVNYVKEYMKYVSYVQIMTYDFYGSWVPYSDFNSPLRAPGKGDGVKQPAVNSAGYVQPLSQEVSVDAWIAAGASPKHLTNGLGFYGRSWSVQSNKDNGLYQQCTGSKNGSACAGIVGDYLDQKQWCDPCNTCYNSGVWMYNNMRGQQNSAGMQSAAPLASGATTASNGWTRKYFDFAQSPTLYSPSYNGKSSFISYDDPVSLKAKAAWAKSKGLGGAMVWELSQDYNKELVSAVRAGWGN